MNIFKRVATIGGCLLLVLNLTAQSQGPYHLSLKRELLYGGGAVGLTLIGLTMHETINDVKLGAIRRPKVSTIDKLAPTVLNVKPADISDLMLFGSIALPNLFWLGKIKTVIGPGQIRPKSEKRKKLVRCGSCSQYKIEGGAKQGVPQGPGIV